METSTPATLRPLHLGELLDRAIRLYRGNFLTFIGIIAVVYVPLMILQTAATALTSTSMIDAATRTPGELFSNVSYWVGILSSFVLSFLQYILVQGIATGALTRAVADSYLGKKTSIVDAYRGIGGSWVSLLGALLLLGLLIILAFVWFLVPCIGWFTGLGMFFVLAAMINPLVPPVVILEKQSAIDSIRRAWSLARRRFWPVLGTILVLALFNLIVVQGPAAIANAILLGVSQSFRDPNMQLVIMSIIQGLVNLVFILLYYPLQMAAITLVYFDLRVRTEGFDIALLTREDTSESDPSDISTILAPQTNESLLTWPDMGNFAILTIAGGGLYFLIISVIMGGVFFLSSLMR